MQWSQEDYYFDTAINIIVVTIIEIILEISGTVPDGIPDEVLRTLAENCKTLKFTNYEFHND